jgi:enamine deaminase RidA (YjgF/YER057c/UK114 family)
MQKTVMNPWQWSVSMGFNQAELVEGASKVLFCAGQTSVDENGAPQHAGDMAAQINLALDNVETVLREAGMTLANVVRLNIYTTDVDAFFASYEEAVKRTSAAGAAPPGTLLGVARLAFPELMVELEATAVS